MDPSLPTSPLLRAEPPARRPPPILASARRPKLHPQPPPPPRPLAPSRDRNLPDAPFPPTLTARLPPPLPPSRLNPPPTTIILFPSTPRLPPRVTTNKIRKRDLTSSRAALRLSQRPSRATRTRGKQSWNQKRETTTAAILSTRPSSLHRPSYALLDPLRPSDLPPAPPPPSNLSPRRAQPPPISLTPHLSLLHCLLHTHNHTTPHPAPRMGSTLQPRSCRRSSRMAA